MREEYLSLDPDFFLFSSRLGLENRLMSQVVMSALSSHLGEEVTLDLSMGLNRRKNYGPCSLGSPYVIEVCPEPQALGSK